MFSHGLGLGAVLVLLLVLPHTFANTCGSWNANTASAASSLLSNGAACDTINSFEIVISTGTLSISHTNLKRITGNLKIEVRNSATITRVNLPALEQVDGDIEFYSHSDNGRDSVDVIGDMTLTALKRVNTLRLKTLDGSIGSLTINNMLQLANLDIDLMAGNIGDVTINAASGSSFAVSNSLIFSTDTARQGKVKSVKMRGLNKLDGDLLFDLGSGRYGDISINDPTDGCDQFEVFGVIKFLTTDNTNGNVDDVSVYGVKKVHGNFLYTAKASSFGDVTITNCATKPVYIDGAIQFSTSSHTLHSVGIIQLGPVSYTTSVSVYVQGSDFSTIKIFGLDSDPLFIDGDVTLTTTQDTNGDIGAIEIGPVGTISGGFDVLAHGSDLEDVDIIGAASGLTVKGDVVIRTLQQTEGHLKSLSMTNVLDLQQDVSIITDGGRLQALSFSGHASGFTVGGDISAIGTQSNEGDLNGLTFSGLTLVKGGILVKPFKNHYGTLSFQGSELTIEGDVELETTILESTFKLYLTGVKEIGGSVKTSGVGIGQQGYFKINYQETSSPSLTIKNDISLYGFVNTLIHNLGRVDGKVDITSDSQTWTNMGLVQLFGGNSFFSVGKEFILHAKNQRYTRSVKINNLWSIDGSGGSSPKYLTAYRNSASQHQIGPLIINSQSIFTSFTSAYSTVDGSNDPQCVNYCHGRGYDPAASSASAACSSCTCFSPYTNGTRCENEFACTLAPTCDCACNPWTDWQLLPGESVAATRTRSCDSSLVSQGSLSCPTLELQGSVTCDPNQEFETAAPTPTSHRTCQAYTTCNADEYESEEGTTTTDRVCTTATTCTSDEFQETDMTTNTDRVCTTLSVCSLPTHFISTNATATSDRVCSPCQTCPTGFEGTPCTTFAQPVCAGCDTCGSGEYVKTACNPPNQQIVCSTCDECDSDQFMDAACTETSNTVCVDLAPECDFPNEYESTAPTATSDRTCSSVISCTPDLEYQEQAATPTSQTQCKAVTPCNFDEYETAAPTSESDRVCATLTACDFQTQYISVAATPTSDRQCANLTPCGTGEYEKIAPSTNGDRVCKTVTACTADEFEDQSPTAFSDRLCKTLTQCVSDSYESQAPTPTSDRVCSSIQSCDANQYILVAATPTSDRACENCTVCPAAVLTACSTSQDTECEGCGSCDFIGQNQYVKIPCNLDDGQTTVCGTCSSCSFPQEYKKSSCTPSADTQCLAVTACPATHYQTAPATPTSNTQCAEIRKCRDDQFEFTAPTLTSNRICHLISLCELGVTYMKTEATSTSDRDCRPVTQCSSSEFESFAPTLEQDRVCDTLTTCTTNEYEQIPPSVNSNRVCQPLSVCTSNAQFEIQAPTPTTNRDCAPLTVCTSTEYQSKPPTDVADRQCTSLTECQANEYISTPHTTISDRKCTTVTTCPADVAVVSAPTATSDRVCGQDFCSSSPCLNGATCENKKQKYKCKCLAGFVGTNCDSNPSMCTANVCVNGGTCTPTTSGPSCICTSAFTGSNCELPNLNLVTTTASPEALEEDPTAAASASSSGGSAGAAIGGAVAGVVLIALLIIVLIMRRKKQTKTAPPENDTGLSIENPYYKEFQGEPQNYTEPKKLPSSQPNYLEPVSGKQELPEYAMLEEREKKAQEDSLYYIPADYTEPTQSTRDQPGSYEIPVPGMLSPIYSDSSQLNGTRPAGAPAANYDLANPSEPVDNVYDMAGSTAAEQPQYDMASSKAAEQPQYDMASTTTAGEQALPQYDMASTAPQQAPFYDTATRGGGPPTAQGAIYDTAGTDAVYDDPIQDKANYDNSGQPTELLYDNMAEHKEDEEEGNNKPGDTGYVDVTAETEFGFETPRSLDKDRIQQFALSEQQKRLEFLAKSAHELNANRPAEHSFALDKPLRSGDTDLYSKPQKKD
eukprot:m.181954 g.181954  ORF g.181954 m.181954 type:complete len:1908 (-) comp25465_c0_seq2:191-5914(-)